MWTSGRLQRIIFIKVSAIDFESLRRTVIYIQTVKPKLHSSVYWNFQSCELREYALIYSCFKNGAHCPSQFGFCEKLSIYRCCFGKIYGYKIIWVTYISSWLNWIFLHTFHFFLEYCITCPNELIRSYNSF